jgi:ATP-dependent Clp protease, protease subunit
MAQPIPAAYVSFSAEVSTPTIEVLMNAFAQMVGQGFTEIHLLLSTPGGSVASGITAYNFLRGLPIKLVTHNIGNVDSIGTVIYLAGDTRYACPQSTFMLHGVSCTFQVGAQLFEKNFEERLNSLKADQERIAAVYANRSLITREQAEGYFLAERTLNAETALERGIVTEIRDVGIPNGSPVFQLVFNRK